MKFKDVKNKAKKEKSPSNSRTIPDFVLQSRTSSGKPAVTLLKIYRGSLKIFLVFIFILAVIIIGLDLQKNIQAKLSVDLEREKLTRELRFWESFIAKHQDYRDAYFQASILEYKLGEITQAKIYVKKGLSLDPNSEDGSKLEKFLEGK